MSANGANNSTYLLVSSRGFNELIYLMSLERCLTYAKSTKNVSWCALWVGGWEALDTSPIHWGSPAAGTSHSQSLHHLE